MNARRVLRLLRACEDGVSWTTLQATGVEAWDACPRPDWLLWLLEHLSRPDAVKGRLFACWCVRNTPLPGGGTVWDLLTDPASRRAVEVAERYARGGATHEELRSAWEAASWAATVARGTASEATRAAAAAAAWTVADESVAERTAESAAAGAGGSAAVLRAQADALRAIYGPLSNLPPTSRRPAGPANPASTPAV
jgi:hypothetical protein